MQAHWIAVYADTAKLRAWVFDAEGEQHFISAIKNHKFQKAEFEAALLNLIDPYLPEGQKTPVILSATLGSIRNLPQMPYATTPCKISDAANVVATPSDDPRIDLHILCGAVQQKPADIIQGEAITIAGFMASHPDFDGIICLPGAYTKWVHISAKEIVSFRTVMTGEMFDLLSTQSVLHETVDSDDWNKGAFLEAVSDAMSSPQRVTAKLFGLRAEALLNEIEPGVIRSRLSGYLSGLELAGTRDYWLGQEVAVVGEPILTAHYTAALSAQGFQARVFDSAPLMLEGFKSVYAKQGTFVS